MAARGEHGFRGKEKDLGAYTVRQVIYGPHERRGELRKYKVTRGGRPLVVYFAHRRPDELFRADTSWAIDISTVTWLKMYGVTHIGVLVTDGTAMLLEAVVFDNKVLREKLGIEVRNYGMKPGTAPGAKGKPGALQYYVPEKSWSMRRPTIEEKTETLAEAMRI
jgi:hypothetical protein